MKNEQPNQEERNRIVDAVVNKIMNPAWLPTKQQDELTELTNRRNAARAKVRSQIHPIVVATTTDGSIHTDLGRAKLLETMVKLYVDELRQFNREEALFMLAFAYADQTLQEFV